MVSDARDRILEWLFGYFGPCPLLYLPLIASTTLAALFFGLSMASAVMWILRQLRGDSTYSARRWFWLDLGLSIGFGAIFLAIIGLTEIPWLIAGVVLFLVSVTLICKSFAQRC